MGRPQAKSDLSFNILSCRSKDTPVARWCVEFTCKDCLRLSLEFARCYDTGQAYGVWVVDGPFLTVEKGEHTNNGLLADYLANVRFKYTSNEMHEIPGKLCHT